METELIPAPEARPRGLSTALVPRKWDFEAPVHFKTAFEVCEQIAFGRTLREIELDPAFPPAELFLVWLMREPNLALAFARARELSAYAMEEEAIFLLRAKLKAPGTTAELRAAELMVQQLRWSAGKRNPGIFSEKAAVNVTVPVQINTSLDLGKGQGAGSAPGFPNIYELKAEVVKEVDLPASEPETKAEAKRLRGPQKRVLMPRAAPMTEADRNARARAVELAQRVAAARQERTRARNREWARKAKAKARREGTDVDSHPQD